MDATTNKEFNLTKYRVINQIIFYSIIFIAFLITLIYYVLPNISEISSQKDKLNENINYFNKISKSGISFSDFKETQNNVSINDSYTKNLVNTMDSDFFVNNFTNNTGENYLSFLDNLKLQTVKEYTSQEFITKKNELDTLLPVYSDSSSVFMENLMDDSTFVNNIENLLDKFNLVSSDAINLGNMILVDSDEGNTKKINKDLTESEIYYFDIPLNVTGTKKDVINFIHYLENVGSININGENIIPYKDNFISPNFSYDGQIAEIEKIDMANYIDSDNSTRINSQDSINFIKNTQGQEKFDVSLTVRFFVKGLAGYKVQEFVKNTYSEYNNLSKNVNKLLKTTDQKDPNLLQIFSKLNQVKRFIETIKNDVDDLMKKANKKEDLGNTYNKMYKLSLNIKNAEQIYLQQEESLKTLKSNQK
ncbi:MAG: hypothetical protein PHR68_03490 [Candidatus Gracilibacteria bacterium]|nr:hypothetical protein [Candidatus Gracilibacteria bacterium]